MRKGGFAISAVLTVLLSGCYEWNQITNYPVKCSGVQSAGNCSDMWLALNRTTFEVLKERQEVIHWMPGFPFAPKRETNCVVRDAENWDCRYPGNSTGFGFVNGEFRDDPPYGDIIYVGKWTWWGVRLGNQRKLLWLPGK